MHPAIIPGKLNGNVIDRKTRHEGAPKLLAASSIDVFMELSAPNKGKTMKDKYTWTTAKITPNSLYINGSGFEIKSH